MSERVRASAEIQLLGKPSDGLSQKTARVTFHITGNLEAWHTQVKQSPAIEKSLSAVLPQQAFPLEKLKMLLEPVQQARSPKQAFAAAILNLSLAIQREARDAVWTGRITKTDLDRNNAVVTSVVALALPYERHEVLKHALNWATTWWMFWAKPAAHQSSERAYLAKYRTWLDAAQAGGLSPNTLRFALAAYERGWPVSIQKKVLHIGWGAARKSLDSSFTGETSAIATRTSKNKHMTNALLGEAGLPVPRSALVRDWPSLQKKVQDFGWPVVIKPANLDQGVDVVPGIQDEAALRQAFDKVITHKAGAVLVETHIPGDDHRILVVKGRVLMAVRRIPGGVHGDGSKTVTQLVEDVNMDPRRGTSRSSLLMNIKLDEEALSCLKEQGLSPESIPKAGQFVYLRRTANIATGGTGEDVSDKIHPDNRVLAERAARILGLDIAGVDFLCRDISRSWRDIGGGICEVNAQPGFRPHWLSAPSRDINGEILDILFSEGAPRVPTVTISGASEGTSIAHMVHSIWQRAGFSTGLSCRKGVQLGEAWLHSKSVPSVHGACQMLLPDPSLQALVLELHHADLRRYGHPLDRYEVSALLNIDADEIGSAAPATHETSTHLQAQILERTTKAIVVNADDVRCLQMGNRVGRASRILVSAEENNSQVLRHCQAGGKAVYRQRHDELDWVCLCNGTEIKRLMPIRDIAVAEQRRHPEMVKEVFYAIALAWAQGVEPQIIHQAICNFQAVDASL